MGQHAFSTDTWTPRELSDWHIAYGQHLAAAESAAS